MSRRSRRSSTENSSKASDSLQAQQELSSESPLPHSAACAAKPARPSGSQRGSASSGAKRRGGAGKKAAAAAAATPAAGRPPRRRAAASHPISLKAELQSMGFDRQQIAAALAWRDAHPKADKAAVCDHVLQGCPCSPKPPKRAKRTKRKDTSQQEEPAGLGGIATLQKRIRAQINKIRRENDLLDAYSSDSALARTAEGQVVPQAELQRAQDKIRSYKHAVRDALRDLHELQTGDTFRQLSEAALETDAVEGGGIDEKDIICSACCSGEIDDGIPLYVCDAPNCRLAFHNQPACLGSHVASAERIKQMEEDDGKPEGEWWCPMCEVMYDGITRINEYFERDYERDLTKWSAVFAEVAGGSAAAAAEVDGSAEACSPEDEDDDFDGEASDGSDDDDDDDDDDDQGEEEEEEEEESLREADVKRLPEGEIRRHLERRGLPTGGKRAMIQKRLQQALSRERQQHMEQEEDVELDDDGDEGGDDIELDDSAEEGDEEGEEGNAGGEEHSDVSDSEDDDIDLPEEMGGGGAAAAAMTSPRGRGKRKRGKIDYTVLNYQLFGLPGDDTDEEDEQDIRNKGKAMPAAPFTKKRKKGAKPVKAKSAEDDAAGLSSLFEDGSETNETESDCDWSPGARGKGKRR